MIVFLFYIIEYLLFPHRPNKGDAKVSVARLPAAVVIGFTGDGVSAAKKK
jgi:hypothetical protein